VGQARSPAPGARAYHVPVLAAEVVDIFRPLERGTIVDATFGGGGHSLALLDALPDVEIIAIDRDPDARAMAPDDPRLRFVAGNFAELGRLAVDAPGEESSSDDAVKAGRVDGVLFDLGVSSHQLDVDERGFSYHRAGPLDMRMDRSSALSADDVVNRWAEGDLVSAFRRFGEERFSRRIAAAIVASRPIGDTAELASVIAAAVPAPARRRRHPARRVFQAIRIAVNGELDALEVGLESALDLVREDGRVAVITYHSLEDRMVKRRFAAGTAGCDCPPGLPVCSCGRVTELRSLTRGGITPSAREVERNPRARSARLRAVEKVAS
jgi:16S rRNA (cytosine1402-N4)-methyltransferase